MKDIQKKSKQRSKQTNKLPEMEESARKMRKKEMTKDELRRSYYDKANAIRLGGGEKRILKGIWDDLITGDPGWTFQETMSFIQDQATEGDAKVSVLLSTYLFLNDLPWKHWFFLDFPDVVQDLKLSQDSQTPFGDWQGFAEQNYAVDMSLRHEDDPIFRRVRWRRSYMWMTMFERRCMKYYADFVIGASKLRHQRPIRESVVLEQQHEFRIKKVKFTQDGVERNVGWLFASLFGENAFDYVKWERSYGFVYKAWCAWNLFQINAPDKRLRDYTKLCGKAVIVQEPRVGKDQYDVRAKRYTYNFTPEMVESFMRWYVLRMVVKGTLEGKESEHRNRNIYGPYMLVEKFLDVCAPRPQQLAPVVHMLNIEQASVKLGYLRIDEQRRRRWVLLEKIPLCPRRIDKMDPEKRAIQFLGQQQQSSEEEDK